MFCVGITSCLSQHQTHNRVSGCGWILFSLFLQFLISLSLYENTTASERVETGLISQTWLSASVSFWTPCGATTATTPRCPTVLDWIQVWGTGGQLNTISTTYTRMWCEPLVLLPSRPPLVTQWGCDVPSLTHCQSGCLVSGWDHSAHVQASSPDTYSSTGEGLDPFSPGAEGGPAQSSPNSQKEWGEGNGWWPPPAGV